ncbi:LAFE_0F02652g1_1 [Lachancea fermentati]|uniref:LAFE_0F02652g1_1 n=1 Tax=Lachancea fermentati TaxID=4955 RepID=A0A1G4MEI1_LACFM|nr:LAFE_0F02652g1_1 [Lachancea fermentati]
MSRLIYRSPVGLRYLSCCPLLQRSAGGAGNVLPTPVEILNYVNEKLERGELSSIKTYKNKLIRHHGNKYVYLVSQLKILVETQTKFSIDDNFLSMIFYRHSGTDQYFAFSKKLSAILDSKASTEEKIDALYRAIRLQHALYPTLARQRGILVPDDVHQWFWVNIPKSKSFTHYYFLIQNDVLLSSPKCSKFMNRLLKGSEMDIELVTFQIFLHDPKHQEIFYSKFVTLYNFSQLSTLTNFLIDRSDFRHTKVYFSALLSRLEKHELLDARLAQKERNAVFIKFVTTLLNFLKRTSNHEMFLDTLSMIMTFVHKQKLSARFLHYPLLLTLQYLRAADQHSDVLKLISLIQAFPLPRHFKFDQILIGEIISTLRFFNDPKMTISYIITAYTNRNTVQLLNELGIWSLVHYSTVRTLPEQQLKRDGATSDACNIQISKRLKTSVLPNTVVLTELYRITLDFCHASLPEAEFKQIVIDLFRKYKETLQRRKNLFYNPDCGILNVFIYNLRYKLREDRLVYEIVKEFYGSGIELPSNVSSPFGLVLYHNYMLTQSEVSTLLFLMEKNKIPLDFRVIVSMVFRYLKLNQVDEAHLWYQKLLHAGFPINHRSLLKCAIENNWKLPNGVETELLLQETCDESASKYEGLEDLLGDEFFEEDFEDKQIFANNLIELWGSLRDPINSSCK